MAAVVRLFLGVAPIVMFFWMIRSNKSGGVEVPHAKTLIYFVRYRAVGEMSSFTAFKITCWLRDALTVVMIGCAVLGGRQFRNRGEFYRWILFFAVALIALPAASIFAYSTVDRKSTRLNSSHLGISYA